MQDPTLTTLAEQSGFARTGRTDEVTRLCAAFTQAWPKVVHTLEFGRSAEGRPMRALIACRADPRQVPLLMLQGGIHPGESDGKDAGFIALRELLGETASPGVLERIAILFVPAFNVDGHERFGRWNRPNQNGPEEMGWRTTAQNLNLNRDYTKADAPETHSWKAYATRVRVTRNTIVALAELLAAHGEAWREQALRADRAAARLAGAEVVLDYDSHWREPAANRTDAGQAGGTELIDFKGYAYTRAPSAISGEPVTVYDPKTPQVWRVPLRDRVTPSLSARAPLGGYVVPCACAQDIGARLALHGIACEPVRERSEAVRVEAFHASGVEFTAAPFEGRMRVKLAGGWARETHDIAAGALFVPIAQPAARLVMHLLEPQAPDSFAAWGFFNACFEQKEYLEPYVAERIARDMLAKQPQLGEEFSRRLKEDPAFAASPAARREFFLRRHSSWDSRLNLYPALRVDELLASVTQSRTARS